MTAPENAVDEVQRELADLNQMLIAFVKATSTLQPDLVRPEDAFSLTQGFLLMELGAHSMLSQRDLGDRLGLGKSTVSRLVAELDSEGLVGRDRNPSNHRLHRVWLTERGKAAAIEVTAGYFRRHAQILMSLTPEERHALSIGLTAFVRSAQNGYQ